ncbi:hypothetical protein [Aureispira anguillae]|uniref:Uncharacterized protein n=1 Tax=Aureispira anguillae TaxID=2864201 RepID=A0A915YHA1_9BACT|nr:hypothetical protein [Aureispira anguillae]BDS12994.1 hypothetical protein AsAng_0037220 [Aureispira anguillae]BDS13057.1 hypothetical protein AsAng_0037850 [Aureispira anguillae]
MSTKNEVIRIYTPISADLCVPTPHVMIRGKLSYMPLPDDVPAEYELITDVEELGGIVDKKYSLISNSSEKGHEEEGRLELILGVKPNIAQVGKVGEDGYTEAETHPAKIMVKVGLDGDSLQIFPSSTAISNSLVIDGTYGKDTLEVIAKLARNGSYLKIDGMHIDADDDKHFTAKMVERRFSHDGTSAGDKNHLYPKALASDEQTTIRTIEKMNTFLDGFVYLEIPVYQGVGVNMTLETVYVK